MKKLTATLFLTAVLALNIFAEGDIPTGNRDCPPLQQCPPPCAPGIQCRTGNSGNGNDKSIVGTGVLDEIAAWLTELFS